MGAKAVAAVVRTARMHSQDCPGYGAAQRGMGARAAERVARVARFGPNKLRPLARSFAGRGRYGLRATFPLAAAAFPETDG